MRMTSWDESEDTCPAKVNLVELWEFRAGWVELEKAQQNFESLLGMFGLCVIGTWEPRSFPQQVSNTITVVSEWHVKQWWKDAKVRKTCHRAVRIIQSTRDQGLAYLTR